MDFTERLDCWNESRKSGYEFHLQKLDREIVENILKISEGDYTQIKHDLRNTIQQNSIYKFASYRYLSFFDFLKQNGINSEIVDTFAREEQEEYQKFINKSDKFFRDDPKWIFFKEKTSAKDVGYSFQYNNQNGFQQEFIGLEYFLNQNSRVKNLHKSFKQKMKRLTEKRLKDIKKHISEKNLKDNPKWLWFEYEISKGPNIANRSYMMSSIDIRSAANGELKQILENYIARQNTDDDLQKYRDLLEKYNQLDKTYLNFMLFQSNLIPDEENSEKQTADANLSRAAGKEIHEASRNPNAEENQNLQAFKFIAEKHGINEIRIIDAESLIKSMYLDKEEKDRLLKLLKDGTKEEVENEIEEFLSRSNFVEDSSSFSLTNRLFHFFKPKKSLYEKVKNSLIKGAEKSKIYRDEIITLIAWSKVKEPALYDTKVKQVAPYHIEEGRTVTFKAVKTGSGFADQTINIDFSEELFLEGLSKDSQNHLTVYYETADAMFHEIGHLISGNMAEATRVPLQTYADPESSDLAMEIAGESIKTVPNKKGISIKRILGKSLRFFGKCVNFLSGGRIADFTKEKLMQYAAVNGMGDFLPEKKEDRMKLFEKVQTSEALYTRTILFQNTTELLQILGFFTNNYDGKNILYLNKLSDCAQSAFLGTHIRTNHLGKDKNKTGFSEGLKNTFIKPALFFLSKGDSTKEINIDFYKALLQAYGADPDDYFKRLEENQKHQ